MNTYVAYEFLISDRLSVYKVSKRISAQILFRTTSFQE